MGLADFFEWLGILVSIPLTLAWYAFVLVTCLFVYFDAQERSKSSLFALGLALATGLAFWPLSLFAYLACTSLLDRGATQTHGS